PPKKPAKPNQDVTKGQGQVQGGDGVFGRVYTLNSGWNFAVLKACYTVDPFNSYNTIIAKPDEKLLVLTVAIKNATPADLYFGGEEWQAVGEEGHDYPSGDYRLASLGNQGANVTLKPGQGAGQMPDKDEMAVAFSIPGKARITKLILKQGRKFVPGEEVVRYYIAELATKSRDGQDGNPMNKIAPLPDFVRDPADKTGAVALPEPPIKIGFAAPTGYYAASLDSIALSTTEKCKGQAPEEGKQFAILTFTVKNIWSKEVGLFDFVSNEEMQLRDADGEKYSVFDGSGARKAKRDEAVADDFTMKPGESYTFRIFYQIPKDAKPKSIAFGQAGGRKYVVDLTAAK
ncbi:MAG TPA: DUF4352 domain-containing protein, partial [Chthonomonadaceae bacterium]|nr:DUF4352 domain-containing protein [Chthonomonadaceae bacterium]